MIGDVRTDRTSKRSLWLAVVLLAPALVFVPANILKFQLGVGAPYDALEPALAPRQAALALAVTGAVVVGPAASLLLALLPILRLRVRHEHGVLRAVMVLPLRPAHLVVAMVSVMLLAVIGLYLVAENLPGGLRPH